MPRADPDGEPQHSTYPALATVRVVGFRPTDSSLAAQSGVTYHDQNEGGGGNVPYYEIGASGDTIDLSLNNYLGDLNNVILGITTVWGDTAFDVRDRDANATVISTFSGFDSDVWLIDLPDGVYNIRLTNFADTQAAVYPFLRVFTQALP